MKRLLIVCVGALSLLGCEVGTLRGIPCNYVYGDYQCRVRYSIYFGYYRACGQRVLKVICYDAGVSSEPSSVPSEPRDAAVGSAASQNPSTSMIDDDENDAADAGTAADDEATSSPDDTEAQAAAGAGAETSAPVTRELPFDFPCERDTQCGTGRCIEGECFYGCDTDADCGSGDRCAADSGKRICRADPNPPLVCTRSSDCSVDQVCLNASCRESCETTEQCSNLFDRCLTGVCQADRRPLVECVFNSECDRDRVCLDGACTALSGP